ncbi:MAG: glucose-6-phosphate isomerase, partial [bacterium]
QINKTGAWRNLWLHSLGRKIKPLNLRKAFTKDDERSKKMSIATEHAFYDYSFQLVTDKTMDLLFKLAETAGLKNKIEDMFNGEKINRTEGRAVLHAALRQLSDKSVYVDGQDVIPGVKEVLAKIKKFSDEILSGTRLGVTGKQIKNVVAIGIGGSYLGPEYLAEACKAYAREGMNLRFVANVDGTDFAQKTADLDPEETMFIIVSKTFTTAETMMNANTAKAWMLEKLSGQAAPKEIIKKHFVAASTAAEKVSAFGIDTANMFGFWDWVGGRYSATSAVGMLPLSLFLGYDQAEQILKGAEWMDNHFRNTPFHKNIPVIAGLVDIWNINFLGINVRGLLPYCQALLKLAPHTQQVEMESNGKRVDLFGRLVKFATGEVVFGEPGTNGQHSFYQLIHQGMKVAADFIAVIKPQYALGKDSAESVSHHKELNSNTVAQREALAFGKTAKEVAAELAKAGKSPEEIKNLTPHKVFPGNRPSSTLLVEELTPFTAGVLLAFTEHRTAVKGFIWGINSFDQWGVELGKVLGVKVRNLFKRGNTDKDFRVIPAEDLVPETTARVANAFITGELPNN